MRGLCRRGPKNLVADASSSSGGAPSAVEFNPDSTAQKPRAIGMRSAASLALALAVILALAAWWYWDTQHYVRTDAAYAHADIVPITTPVEGMIGTIEARENSHVDAGQLLVSLDLADAKIARGRGQAELMALQASIESANSLVNAEQSVVAQRAAALSSTLAEKARVDANLRRIRTLAERGWVTKQTLETAEADSRKAAAAVDQVRAEIDTNRVMISARQAERNEAAAQIDVTRRDIESLDRTLSLSSIRAPVGGTVANLTARLGQRLNVGDTLMFIVPDSGRYIIANFKETEISAIKPGQKARIWADAYGNRSFEGVVESLSPATGSQFAILPINNAAGTFTRVVQRLPVRIRLINPRDYQLLRPGLSLNVSIQIAE
jgi:membrane fusion protein (multidrug efflux system)